MSFTSETILAMAPDASAAKSGKDLAAPRKWSGLGADARSVWGLCQGSGKDPYQTRIDLSEPAFKCSCPSRKFPCKHALGLFLIFAEQRHALNSERWFLRDTEGLLLPFASMRGEGWKFAASSGGESMQVFGEWNGGMLSPMTAWVNERCVIAQK